MRSGKKPTRSRSQQRQRLLRELAAEEAVFINYGGSYSRAVEAIEPLREALDLPVLTSNQVTLDSVRSRLAATKP